MKQRVDFELVCHMVKRGLIAEKKAKEWLALPMMFIECRPTISTGSEFFDFITDHGAKKELSFIPSEDHFILDECMVYTQGTESFRYGRIKILSDTEFEVEAYIKLLKGDESSVRYVINFTGEHPGYWKMLEFNGKPFTTEQARQYHDFIKVAANSYCNHLLVSFQQYCIYNNQQDRYLMSVSPEKKITTVKTGRKGRLTPNVGPSLIYLDEFPKTPLETKCGDTGSVEPHKRRGHHYTLRHERFKHHPLYMVENILWRKPIWIGDRTKIVNGSVYTVLDK